MQEKKYFIYKLIIRTLILTFLRKKKEKMKTFQIPPSNLRTSQQQNLGVFTFLKIA